ncbi:MAG: endoribonuclease MazF [Elusimicrobia bacterium]|nr:endoribonuclease MazF [Elusimicrobiota bacterium]
MVSAAPYCPKRGDVVWLSFSPRSGREQAGERPALTLSPEAYNRKVGLALFCPLTTRVKGYPFEVAVPEGSKARGVVLADQVRSLDWRARGSRFLCRLPEAAVGEVREKLEALLG